MKLYVLFDKVSKTYIKDMVYTAENDCDFVRRNLYGICLHYPVRDIEYHCVADVSEDFKVKPLSLSVGDWNAYKFPKVANSLKQGDDLTPEEISDQAQAQAANLVASVANENNNKETA